MPNFISLILVAAIESLIGWLVARWLDDHFGK